MRSLQCARAVAALLVVYFHATLAVGHFLTPGTFGPVIVGKAGVDVFFVLSGYIIWTSTLRTPTTTLSFLRKRLLRVAPLYWLLTTLAAATAFALPALLRSTRFEPSHVLASLFFVPWPNPASSRSIDDLMTPVIVPGWTLNFEMAFYLLFSMALFCRPRFRPAAVGLIFALAIAAVAAFGRWYSIVRFYDPLLLLEFLCGVVVGALDAKGFRLPPMATWPALLIGIGTLVGLDSVALPVHRLASAGLPSILIVVAAISIERADRWPNLPWLVVLGDASFSLYLIHGFVLAGIRMCFELTISHLTTTIAAWSYVIGSVGMSCCAGVLCHRLVERPLGSALANATRIRRAGEQTRVIEPSFGR